MWLQGVAWILSFGLLRLRNEWAVGNFPRGILFGYRLGSTSSCISKARNLGRILIFFQTAAYLTTFKISLNPLQFCFQYIILDPYNLSPGLLAVAYYLAVLLTVSLPVCTPLIPSKWHCKINIVSYYSSV